MARTDTPTAFWNVTLTLCAGLALLQLGGQAILWFLPYHLAGLANELGLLALGLGAGALIAHGLRRTHRLRWPPWRAGLSIGLLLYAAASFAMLGWSPQTGLRLDAHRYTVFSAPGCEFAARFPGPANGGRLRGDVFEAVAKDAAAQATAIYADLPSLTALRADCQTMASGMTQDQVALAVAAARQWAARIGIEITDERLERTENVAVFRLRGSLRGSALPQSAGGPGRTLAAIDSHIGARSIMTVYVFQPQTGPLTPLALAFLDGVQRK
jgi:hypothetical protein